MVFGLLLVGDYVNCLEFPGFKKLKAVHKSIAMVLKSYLS